MSINSYQLGQPQKTEMGHKVSEITNLTTMYEIAEGNEFRIQKFCAELGNLVDDAEDYSICGAALEMSMTKAAVSTPESLAQALTNKIYGSLTASKFVDIMVNKLRKKAPFEAKFPNLMHLWKPAVESQKVALVKGSVRHETFVFDWVDGDFGKIVKIANMVNDGEFVTFVTALGYKFEVGLSINSSCELLKPLCKRIDDDYTVGQLVEVFKTMKKSSSLFFAFPELSQHPTPWEVLEEEKIAKTNSAKLSDDVTVHQWLEGDSEAIAELSCDLCNIVSDEVELATLGRAVGMLPLNAAEANEKMLRQKIYEAINNSLTVSKIVDVVANVCHKPTPLFWKHPELRTMRKPLIVLPKDVVVIGETPPDTPILHWMNGELTKIVDFLNIISPEHVATLNVEFTKKAYVKRLEPVALLPFMAQWIAAGATVKQLDDIVCKKLRIPASFHGLFPDLDWEKAKR